MKAPIALLVATLLAGCYAAPTTPRVSADVTPTAEVAAMAAAAGARADVTRSAANCPGPVGVIGGVVCDQDRRPIQEGARVTVKSLDAEVPFVQRVAVIGGAYAVSEAPVGVTLEVSVVGPTGFVRKRELTLTGPTDCNEAESLKATVDFGGAATPQDPTAKLLDLPR